MYAEAEKAEMATFLDDQFGPRKTCSRCGLAKPLTPTHWPIRRRNKDGSPGYYAYCKPCHVEYQRENRYKLLFGLEAGEYDKLREAQGDACAICRRPAKKLRLAVDHDHKTGITRGLLCHRCNRLLGWVFDDPDALDRAAAYLRDFPATRLLGRVVQGRVGRVTKKRRKRRKK